MYITGRDQNILYLVSGDGTLAVAGDNITTGAVHNEAQQGHTILGVGVRLVASR